MGALIVKFYEKIVHHVMVGRRHYWLGKYGFYVKLASMLPLVLVLTH